MSLFRTFGGEKSEHCIWFPLCSKSSLICSLGVVVVYSYIPLFRSVSRETAVLSLNYDELEINYAVQLILSILSNSLTSGLPIPSEKEII